MRGFVALKKKKKHRNGERGNTSEPSHLIRRRMETEATFRKAPRDKDESGVVHCDGSCMACTVKHWSTSPSIHSSPPPAFEHISTTAFSQQHVTPMRTSRFYSVLPSFLKSLGAANDKSSCLCYCYTKISSELPSGAVPALRVCVSSLQCLP